MLSRDEKFRCYLVINESVNVNECDDKTLIFYII